MTETNPNRRKVLLVGHCGPDSWMLKSTVQRVLPDAEPQMVNSDDDLKAALPQARILLVNRVLDGRFQAEDGIELIRSMANGDAAAPSILISNYDDAQRDAEAAGAVPGFGKSELNSDKAAERLRTAYGAA